MFNWIKKLFSKKQPVRVIPPEVLAGATVRTEPDLKLNDPIPWFTLSKNHLGMKEVNGVDTSEILDLFKHTTYDARKAKDYTAAWCSAFVCTMLEESGFKSPHDASAISFKRYGNIGNYDRGSIIVMEHPNGGHHVTFLDEIIDAKTFRGLGGNQSNECKYSVYNRSEIIACRWPVK
jgi:uncharacterized protein (TIGR02594 family)